MIREIALKPTKLWKARIEFFGENNLMTRAVSYDQAYNNFISQLARQYRTTREKVRQELDNYKNDKSRLRIEETQ